MPRSVSMATAAVATKKICASIRHQVAESRNSKVAIECDFSDLPESRCFSLRHSLVHCVHGFSISARCAPTARNFGTTQSRVCVFVCVFTYVFRFNLATSGSVFSCCHCTIVIIMCVSFLSLLFEHALLVLAKHTRA